ncbi:hypothetical protein KL918_004603 [Ogataea parapolymorpha]|uniref:Uncharacterized protein n=1 Tax=Ogataea parapolymorpha (strain ATCC 26012 / BCRC 20466 / JCM 22074 / NRRL Y-7560 / DL-1) TaxID=871575 RepID=W1QKA0_OGAPD|nr:hypothetical protein HPODL_00056 [Ogataea parapolymorpha DL-1]ESX03558.1 hypothetical protein HPODL_00056 [Ogataea parapolymorpha DL-1]KAG7865361.1 hypothetical protein KL918_004603 [Ogataea parapolymorpha]KAG7873806.1 hypothetical protein KL916_001966 [Ogataea parapolymorpha]
MSHSNNPFLMAASVPDIHIVPPVGEQTPPPLPPLPSRPATPNSPSNSLISEEEVLANMPPSPKYTEMPSPGEISIPNNQAIDPLSINDTRPTADPPAYSESSSEVASLANTLPLADDENPPPPPQRPPQRPPRPSRRAHSTSPGRSRYQRPYVQPPSQPPRPLHPIYAPPPTQFLGTTISSPNRSPSPTLPPRNYH